MLKTTQARISGAIIGIIITAILGLAVIAHAQVSGSIVGAAYVFVQSGTSVRTAGSTWKVGIGTTSPYAKLAITGTAGQQNPLFQVASSTNTPYFTIDKVGNVTIAQNLTVTGTCTGCGSGSGSAYPFSLTGNATSTLTQFNGGLTAYASSTIGSGVQNAGLTISGGATTTGAVFVGTTGNSYTGAQFTIKTAHAAGAGGIAFGLGDVGISSSSPLLYSYKVGAGANGAFTILGLNYYLDSSGTGQKIDASRNGWGWTTDTRSTNSGSLTLQQIDTSAVVTNPLIVTSTGSVGVGSTTPTGKLSVNANNTETNSTIFIVGSSTASANTTLFAVSNTGHLYASSTAPTLSSCGTGPGINGDDHHGYITVGGTATACTATFAAPYPARPMCIVTDETGSITATFSYSVTASAITITDTGLSNNVVDYYCEGFNK